ncbi:MAG: dynamin family protein, partial [Oscillospiraceae bacterium]
MDGINDKKIIKLAYNPYTNIFNCKSIDNNGGMHTEAAFDREVASQIHNSATLLKSAEMVLKTIDRFFGEGVRHIEIYFEGIKSDFEDFKAFFNFYSKNNNTKITRIIPDVMWQRPRDTFLHLDQIKDRLLLLFNDIPDIQKELAKYNQIKNNVVNLFVAGVQNVGKSTFINTFIGHNILPTSQRIETAATFVVKESRRFAMTYFYKNVPYSIVFKD